MAVDHIVCAATAASSGCGDGGGTFINTGTIQSANDGMQVKGGVAGIITNSGTIGTTGAGRAIAFSGASAHTLNLLTGSLLNGNVQGGTGTDNLVLQGTGISRSIIKVLINDLKGGAAVVPLDGREQQLAAD